MLRRNDFQPWANAMRQSTKLSDDLIGGREQRRRHGGSQVSEIISHTIGL
jgi:hypothetical protein